jgi:class 3 adenylate cyclase
MTVLFVDIVGSTQHAAALGDAAWRSVVDDLERAVATQLRVLGGELLFTKGDEFVAGFALPAAAVDAAFGIRADARSLGVEVRAGVHAGEVDRRGSTADGIAMHIGRRVCECAEPGQILVSSTVHGLLVGSAIPFQRAGTRELRGLDGSWELYEPLRDAAVS